MSNNVLRESSFNHTEVPKEPVKIKKFTNFSNEDFTWTWNKVPYTFPAKEFRFMDASIADHFAKHLINRELLKVGRENDTSPKNPKENFYFSELYNKAIEDIDTAEGADDTAIEQEVIDRDMRAKLGLEEPKKPLVTPIKKRVAAQKVEKVSREKSEDYELMEGDEDDEA